MVNDFPATTIMGVRNNVLLLRASPCRQHLNRMTALERHDDDLSITADLFSSGVFLLKHGSNLLQECRLSVAFISVEASVVGVRHEEQDIHVARRTDSGALAVRADEQLRRTAIRRTVVVAVQLASCAVILPLCVCALIRRKAYVGQKFVKA